VKVPARVVAQQQCWDRLLVQTICIVVFFVLGTLVCTAFFSSEPCSELRCEHGRPALVVQPEPYCVCR